MDIQYLLLVVFLTHKPGGTLLATCSLLSWQVGFCLLQAKIVIRELLPNGLRESISKVRSSVAYAVSAIAHWDWPEAWPQLFNLLMEMLVSGDVNAVHGAMRVLTGTRASSQGLGLGSRVPWHTGSCDGVALARCEPCCHTSSLLHPSLPGSSVGTGLGLPQTSALQGDGTVAGHTRVSSWSAFTLTQLTVSQARVPLWVKFRQREYLCQRSFWSFK